MLISFALLPCLFEPALVWFSRSSVFIFCQASPVEYFHMLCCYIGVLLHRFLLHSKCYHAVNHRFVSFLFLPAICKPCIRFRWSLYRFQPKSTHLSSGALGLPSWGLVQYFSSRSMHTHCTSHPACHVMFCIMLLAHCTVIDCWSFACCLSLDRARRWVRERGARWVHLRGSRQL